MTPLRAAARVALPWKNGGGVTRDVWVWPHGSGMETFLARVSLADVAGDGPFSLFPGIDRTTAILSGAGFELAVDGMPLARLTPDGVPFSYPGDRPAASRLIDGPVTDLNLMTRRGRFAHGLRRIDLVVPDTLACREMSLLLVASGTVRIAGQTFGPLDAVVSETPALWAVEPLGKAALWIAEFHAI